MFKNIFASATALSLLIAASTASAVTPGQSQLAAAAGVVPGTLSNAELSRLIKAKRDNNNEAVSFILSRSGSSAVGKNSAGLRQIALQLGVEPGTYSAAELSRLASARISDEWVDESFILSGKSGIKSPDDKAVLAKFLGVNPADFTRFELITMGQDLRDN